MSSCNTGSRGKKIVALATSSKVLPVCSDDKCFLHNLDSSDDKDDLSNENYEKFVSITESCVIDNTSQLKITYLGSGFTNDTNSVVQAPLDDTYLSQETSNNVVNDGYGVEDHRDLTSNDYHLEDISNNVVNQKTSNLENMFIPNLQSDGSPSEFTEREANEDCLIITAVKRLLIPKIALIRK
ncbi:unnamed protein product [Callosobruchus maculatus]|uniref:Uncharacterized protein n=1 Tax=Callosobruchus maculatus TaxID=64391 RepID=A0A653CCM1_CALMS|nr:unnamed protein product [Callosobruchus maculatus]